MRFHHSSFRIGSRGESDVRDLTGPVREAVAASGLRQGLVHLFVSGSTCALTTLEYEPGLVEDLGGALERIAPSDRAYEHGKAWGDDNGRSHIRASLIGPSLTVPLVDGTVALGRWQQIVLVEMDTRPRDREILVQVIGE